MTTQEIASRLVELCRQGHFDAAQTELYAEDATSTEPDNSMGPDRVTKGKQGIIDKGHHFMSMVEAVHGLTVSEPMVAGNTFAVNLVMDITMKGQGRNEMAEICLYKVKDGKIISEEFFW